MSLKRLFQFFIVFGATFFSVVFFFSMDVLQEAVSNFFKAPSSFDLTNATLRQARRRDHIRELCSANNSLKFPEKIRTFNQIPDSDLEHLIVDDYHGVIYCYVPKVACTNWKRIMFLLSQNLKAPNGAPYLDPLDLPEDVMHNLTLHKTFNKLLINFGKHSRPLMKQKLQNYTKFLFVRDPFVRLISAFRDKFTKPNDYFYSRFGRKILQRYANVSKPPNTYEEALHEGIKVTFNHFIQYLLDPKSLPYDDHWELVHRLCHPCQIEYDFIGKLETLEEDAEHLLKILGLDKFVQFPSGYDNRTQGDWKEEWFANISLADKRKLFSRYETDFKFFDYQRPDTLLDE